MARAGASWQASAVDDDDDELVMELPVYVCNEFMGSATQLTLLQHPLRPPWRPYDYSKVKSMRMKPNAKRIELDLPLDTKSPNYNDIIEDFKKVKQVTLRSQQVESKTSLAIGTVQDGKLLLVPLDYSLQLRPTLSHLNVGNAKKGKDEDEENSDDEPAMRPVEVQVQKRETERQQQARLNSYAHLAAKEDEEAWLTMALHSADSRPAESIWGRFVKPKDNQIAADMSRPTFLRAFVPSFEGQQNALVAGEMITLGMDGPAGGDGAGPSQAAAETVPAEQLKALEVSLKQLFSKHGVCTMGNIRQWLQDPTSNSGPAREMGTMTDRALHEALMQTSLVVCIRRAYILKATGNVQTDPYRALVLDLFKDKEAVKRSEILEGVHQRKIAHSDTIYNKVLRDIGVSKGSQWVLKTGADM